MSRLTNNLIEAWLDQAKKALAILRAAEKAPALFKPDAIEQARRDYAHAIQQADRREVGL